MSRKMASSCLRKGNMDVYICTYVLYVHNCDANQHSGLHTKLHQDTVQSNSVSKYLG